MSSNKNKRTKEEYIYKNNIYIYIKYKLLFFSPPQKDT